MSAVTLATELGSLSRFERAAQVMSYTGLVPSEHSSGKKNKRGAITKSGNSHLRRVLVESAFHYRHRPKLAKRQRDLQTDFCHPKSPPSRGAPRVSSPTILAVDEQGETQGQGCHRRRESSSASSGQSDARSKQRAFPNEGAKPPESQFNRSVRWASQRSSGVVTDRRILQYVMWPDPRV